MLPLPIKFGLNEWVILLLLIVNIVVYIVLPKRFPSSITVLLMVMSIAIPKVVDHTIAVPPLELYDLNDTNKYELFDLLLYGVYPIFGYLCAYLYDMWGLKIKSIKNVWYILTWGIVAVLVEWVTVLCGIYNYQGWKLIYSFPVYLLVIPLFLVYFIFISTYHKTVLENSIDNC